MCTQSRESLLVVDLRSYLPEGGGGGDVGEVLEKKPEQEKKLEQEKKPEQEKKKPERRGSTQPLVTERGVCVVGWRRRPTATPKEQEGGERNSDTKCGERKTGMRGRAGFSSETGITPPSCVSRASRNMDDRRKPDVRRRAYMVRYQRPTREGNRAERERKKARSRRTGGARRSFEA